MQKIHHCKYDREGLVRDIRRNPDMIALTVNGAGLCGEEAIAYVDSLPQEMKYVPMGCYDPLPDGSCPGHIIN
jgi:hypothetical protein